MMLYKKLYSLVKQLNVMWHIHYSCMIWSIFVSNGIFGALQNSPFVHIKWDYHITIIYECISVY